MNKQYEDKFDKLIAHKENVRRAMTKIAKKIMAMAQTERDMEHALDIVKFGYMHDSSKLKLKSFKHLVCGQCTPAQFDIAKELHITTSPHHPEFWAEDDDGDGVSIHSMLEEDEYVSIYELTCDWYARACEFGQNVKDWINIVAVEKYNFNEKDEIYMVIMNILDTYLVEDRWHAIKNVDAA